MLTTEGWLAFKSKHFGQERAVFDHATDLMNKVDEGNLDYEDFVEQVAKLAKVTKNDMLYEIENNIANEELFKFIKEELKPKYKIGMLSNAGANWLSEMFTPDQLELFDSIALSYEIGATKPLEEAYQTIADRLSVRPEEAVFIDDQQMHCIGARQVGMRAIKYDNYEKLKQDLNKIISQSG